jgi:hypothetical protein
MFFYPYLLSFIDILRIFVPHLYHNSTDAKSQIQSDVVILHQFTLFYSI